MTPPAPATRSVGRSIRLLAIVTALAAGGSQALLGNGAAQAPASPSATSQPSARRAIELRDFYRVESVASPAISPDGTRVAFVRSFIVESENRRHSEIWLAPSDGSRPPSRLTSPAFSATNPSWSPDGALLAFSSRRRGPGVQPAGDGEGDSSVWFLRMDQPSGEAFQIPGVAGSPIFSPDNRWIAFTKPTRARPKPKPEYASDFERQIHERFKGHLYDWMNYRFDGRGYLPDPRDPDATPPDELYLVAREGGEPRQLTRLGVDVQSAAWRPDSGALAIVANEHQRDEYVYERADVWVVDLQGVTRRLTNDGFDHDAPAWTRDGGSLVVRRQQSLNMVIASRQGHGSATDLFRLAVDGAPATNLTASWDLIPGVPVAAPDGAVYFSAGVGGNSHLFRLPAGGGAVEQVTTGDRRLGGFSASSAFDRVTYTVTDPTHPVELYTARLGSTPQDERKLTGFNDALVAEIDLRPVERLAFKSADGTPVEGWIILPRGYDAARGPYPLILSIHGGPHGAYGNDFSFQWQLWAAQGYGVLYTNPRGSTGYGEKFLWGTWGGWGNRDYDDVMAGVDHALGRYALDPKRLGVTGYSYGGFLTDWIVTRTTRFAAAVSGAGISNWISDYGTADIPRTKESEFYGPPWDPKANALLRQQSPIEHVGAARTPMLFIHGESDFRVPIEQAEQMYTALKKQRVPARFVRYPEMSHGGWTPWNTVHRYYQELKWWGQYLGARTTATQQ
jgi:dipeptidyl aminopeptidase/acylaminoacyl peptidase